MKRFKHVVGGVQIKGNCFACEYLNYYEKECYEDTSEEGYFCTKREYKTERQERAHLSLLNYPDDRYKGTAKSCCEIKELW